MQGPSETISISKNISIWQGDLATSTTAGEVMTTEKLVSAGCCFSPQERKEGRVQSPAGTNPNGFSMLTKTRLEIFETKSGAD